MWGSLVSMGWKMLLEGVSGITELMMEVTAVVDIVVVGVDTELLMIGGDVGSPVVFRPVMIDPSVLGCTELHVGRI
jgi:hypothetical protein